MMPGRFDLSCLTLPLLLLCAALQAAEHSTATAQATEPTAEDARDAALAAGAATTAARLLEDGNDALSKSQRYATQGNNVKAAEKQTEAVQLFREAELVAIQDNVLGDAREALKEARAERAKRYAPRTLTRAENLLGQAANTLVRDRTDIEQATDLADEATATARLALKIVRIAREKPATEDLILQHAGSIWELQAAAGVPQEADQNRSEAVTQLAAEISRLRENEARLREDLDDSHEFAAALEEEIRLLDERLGGATAERRELVMRIQEEERKREQLAQAKALFLPTEAEVFQQSEVIVARFVGINFSSGAARLAEDSDTLFAKIKQLLAIYPGADITVEGHTDSKGSDRLNMRLSENRAQVVVERIIAARAAAPEKLTAIGYGETRPIANNETEEGRARNRRIDLVIRPAD